MKATLIKKKSSICCKNITISNLKRCGPSSVIKFPFDARPDTLSKLANLSASALPS